MIRYYENANLMNELHFCPTYHHLANTMLELVNLRQALSDNHPKYTETRSVKHQLHPTSVRNPMEMGSDIPAIFFRKRNLGSYAFRNSPEGAPKGSLSRRLPRSPPHAKRIT